MSVASKIMMGSYQFNSIHIISTHLTFGARSSAVSEEFHSDGRLHRWRAKYSRCLSKRHQTRYSNAPETCNVHPWLKTSTGVSGNYWQNTGFSAALPATSLPE